MSFSHGMISKYHFISKSAKINPYAKWIRCQMYCVAAMPILKIHLMDLHAKGILLQQQHEICVTYDLNDKSLWNVVWSECNRRHEKQRMKLKRSRQLLWDRNSRHNIKHAQHKKEHIQMQVSSDGLNTILLNIKQTRISFLEHRTNTNVVIVWLSNLNTLKYFLDN